MSTNPSPTFRERNHGLSATPLYKRWASMKGRCSNQKGASYRNYGARGIKVCKEWHSYANFYWDMIKSFNEHVKKHGLLNTTIDRIDNNKGYSKENCRWATMRQQQNNRRNNIILEYKGKKYSLTELSRKLGVPWGSLNTRLLMGWSPEKTLTAPIRRMDENRYLEILRLKGTGLSHSQIGKIVGLTKEGVRHHVNRKERNIIQKNRRMRQKLARLSPLRTT